MNYKTPLLFFVFIFSLFVAASLFFAKQSFAANETGDGYAVPVWKPSANFCGGASEKVQIAVRDAISGSLVSGSIFLQNVAAQGSTASAVGSNAELDCIDVNQGIWVSVWGVSGHQSWNSAALGAGAAGSHLFNYCCGFKSVNPAADIGLTVLYNIYLYPTSYTIAAAAPAPNDTYPGTTITSAVDTTIQFSVNLTGQFTPPGCTSPSNIANMFFWSQEYDNSTGLGIGTPYTDNDGSFGLNAAFSSTISYTPFFTYQVGHHYRWYAQYHEHGIDCPLLSGTIPVTGQFPWQYFTVSAPNTLNVNSSGAASVVITGAVGLTATTNYVKTSASTISGTITAPATSGGKNFSSWSGCTSTSGNNCTVSATGGATQTVTATYVNPPAVPTVSIMATPNPVAFNGAAILTWTITGATSCTASANMPAGNWSTGGSDVVGVTTGSLIVNTTYTLNCTGPGGSASGSVIVTVLPSVPYPHGCRADYDGNGTINAADQTIFTAVANGNTTLHPTAPGTVDPKYDLTDDDVKNSTDALQMAKLVTLNYSSCLPVPPVPIPPACPAGNFGSTLNFPWVWTGSGLTSFDIRVSDTTTYTTFATKNVTGGVMQTTGTGGWSGTGFNSLGNLSLAPNTIYFWSMRAITTVGTSSYGFNARIPASTCPPPTNPAALNVTSGCVGSNVQASFSFVDNSTTEDEFILDINSAPWIDDNTPSPWGPKALATTSKVGVGGVVTWVWSQTAGVDSGDTDATTTLVNDLLPQQNKTYYWRVIAHNIGTNQYSSHIYPPSTTVVPGALFTTSACVPLSASALSVSSACLAGAPSVTFTFTDNSISEDLFWLDVNGVAWTGLATPSPWGVKTITRSAAEKSGTGAVTYVWSGAAALDAGGDVDPILAGQQIVPDVGKTYWWRVKAHNNTAGDSAHVYPPNAAIWPGTSFTTPASCVALPGAPTLTPIVIPPPCPSSTTAPNNYIGGSDPSKKLTFSWTAATGTVTSYEVRVTGPTSTFLDDPGGWAFTTVSAGTLSVDSGGNPPAPPPANPPKWVSSPGLSADKTVGKLLLESTLVGNTTTDGTSVNGWTGSQYGEVHFRITSAAGATYNWEVIARNSGGGTASVKSSFFVPFCPPPVDPSTLNVTPSCVGSNVQASFSFVDNSTTEDEFTLDINSAPWIDDSTPSPWGLKTLPSVTKLTVGTTITWVWSQTAGVGSGDTDATTPLVNDLLPKQGRVYYWRVIAHDVTKNVYSNHIYPPSTTVVPGTLFTTPSCVPPGVPTTPTLGNLPACLFLPGGYGPGLTFTWGNPSAGYKIEVSDTANTAGGFYSGANVAVKTVATGGASSTTGVGGWTGPLGIVGLNNLDLQINQSYWWHVQNINSLGVSTFADGGSFIVGQCPPPDPINLQVHYPSCSDHGYGGISTSGILDGSIDAARSDMIRFTWDGGLPAQSPNHEVYVIEGDVNFTAVDANKGIAGPTSFANIYIPNLSVASEIKDGTPTWSNLGSVVYPIVNAGSLNLRPNITYSWFVQGRASTSGSSPVSNWVKGGTINSLDCPYHNLHVETYDDPATPSEFYDDTTCTPVNAHPAANIFLPGANLCTKVRITNISPALYAQVAPAATLIGIWPAGVSAPPGPFVCSGQPYGPFSSSLNSLLTAPVGPLPTTQSATAGSSFSTTLGTGFLVVGGVTTATTVASAGSLAAGATAEIIVHFTVPNWKSAFTAPIIADPGCANTREVAQTKDVLASWSDNTKFLNYQVDVNGFFDTNFGDAGSGGGGAITVSQSPGAINISDYLIAASGTLGGAIPITAPWKISGYGSRLQMPTSAGAYDYMNKKFRAAAGTSCPAAGFANGVNICTGNITIDSAASSYSNFPTGTAVVFIDGNLTINSNYTGSTSTSVNSVVFIVSGSVNVRGGSNPVTAIDGVYIVGGAFNSNDGLGALTVNGGVYAGSVALTRTSITPTTAAGEIFNVQIKNLLLFNSMLGSNSTVWQEVAP